MASVGLSHWRANLPVVIQMNNRNYYFYFSFYFYPNR